MNLKEAFRFQNVLQGHVDEAQSILRNDNTILNRKSIHLRSKVVADAEDATVLESPETEYTDCVTEMAGFVLWLLEQRQALSAAVRQAKAALPIDIDSESGLNRSRQNAAQMFRRMSEKRSTDVLVENGGQGYRFNADGNQVSYKCDVRRITTINFDRNVIRKYAAELSAQADKISKEMDRCIVNTEVSYTPPFDVNDTFADIFEHYRAAL